MLPHNVNEHEESKQGSGDATMKGASDKKMFTEMQADVSTEAGISTLSVSPSGARTIVGSFYTSSSGENSGYRPKEEIKAPS